MGGWVRQGVVGRSHCQGPVLTMSGWGERVRWELRGTRSNKVSELYNEYVACKEEQ